MAVARVRSQGCYQQKLVLESCLPLSHSRLFFYSLIGERRIGLLKVETYLMPLQALLLTVTMLFNLILISVSSVRYKAVVEL